MIEFRELFYIRMESLFGLVWFGFIGLVGWKLEGREYSWLAVFSWKKTFGDVYRLPCTRTVLVHRANRRNEGR